MYITTSSESFLRQKSSISIFPNEEGGGGVLSFTILHKILVYLFTISLKVKSAYDMNRWLL